MKLHNTLSRNQPSTQFVPIEKGVVRMYSCGPTVYDNVHIGNLRAFIVADVLRRTLQAQNLKVEHVMNFTDVDDKTIRRSAEQYPSDEPLTALQKLTEQYEQVFVEDMDAIGNDIEAIEFVRATESIEAMQELIRSLHEHGMAYVTDDGVYFSISAYQAAGNKYGQLLKLNAANTSESRIDNDEYDKASVHDFALWKKQKGQEPSWDFEIDGKKLNGRPGWHIECSAMSSKLLDQPFDIHTGGVDLIFPHHENEIAQSTAASNTEYARYFVHNEHLLVDGKKMSKSLHNFYTLRDIQDKGFDPMSFRLLVLQSHYRKQMNFSWDALEAAQNRLNNLTAMASLLHQSRKLTNPGLVEADFQHYQSDILEAFLDDMNIPSALATLSTVSEEILLRGLDVKQQENFKEFLKFVDALFGLELSDIQNITAEQQDLLDARETARAAKAWDKSDALRNELLSQGISVQDTAYGQVWSRMNIH